MKVLAPFVFSGGSLMRRFLQVTVAMGGVRRKEVLNSNTPSMALEDLLEQNFPHWLMAY
jgi:hypothetical protein